MEAQRLLGHSSVSQTATYLVSLEKALESAIDRKEHHEQQLAEAHRHSKMPPPETSDAEAGRVISVGPDRIR